jgi:hypothetical protein
MESRKLEIQARVSEAVAEVTDPAARNLVAP